MSLSKKYVYVHQCSFGKSNDNFRNVTGRVWVENTYSGLQYGYEVNPKPVKMEFGPILDWGQKYFKAVELPAKTQIVSITPNPTIFPPEIDPKTGDTICCGWKAFLRGHFRRQFNAGTPPQILKAIINIRKRTFERTLGPIDEGMYKDPFFGENPCGKPISPRVLLDEDIDLPPLRLYRDMWFNLMTPFSQAEDFIIEGKEKALHSDVDFNYNFYLNEYERDLASNRIPEIRIPNLYLVAYYPGDVPYVMYLRNNAECRYREYSRLMLAKGFRDLLIPIKQLPFVQDKNVYAATTPMDATISFGTDRSTFVADALEDSKMECTMLRRCSEGEVLISPDRGPSSRPAPYTRSTEDNYTPPVERRNTDHRLKYRFAKRFHSTVDTDKSIPSGPYDRSLQTFDFYTWLMGLPDLPVSSVAFPEDHVFLGLENESTNMALKAGRYSTKLSYLANYFILSGKVNDIATTHLRSYQQMMVGNDPHSEAILYRISKYSTEDLRRAGFEVRSKLLWRTGVDVKGSLTGENSSNNLPEVSEQVEAMFDLVEKKSIQPIQNIWIPNSNTVDIVEYVDTQVKYNTGYTYLVTAYELSVGTEYFYSQMASEPAPKVCPDDVNGPIDQIGPLTRDQFAPIEAILRSPPSSLTDLYAAVATEIKKFKPNFRVNGEGIGFWFASWADVVYIVSYCGEWAPPDELGLDLVVRIPNLESTDFGGPASDPEMPCKIFTRLEKYRALKTVAPISTGTGVVDPTIATVTGTGVDTTPAIITNTYRPEDVITKIGVKSCPEEIDGKVRTRSVSGSKFISNTEKFLAKNILSVTCECPPPELCKESFLVTTIPTLKVHQVPYFLWSGQVVDAHPVGPDVEIAPYRADNDELLFLVGAGVSSYRAKPIPIRPSDRGRFDDLLVNQKSKDGRVEFRSDDPIRGFEVFMLETPPRSYRDFDNGLYRRFNAKVDPDQHSVANQRTDAISFIEKVVPNKKYYYTFRSIDVHGHMSNPTPIYQVELIDADGAIYPLVNIYEMESELPVDMSKNAQRLIQIRPDYLQSLVDLKQTDFERLGSAASAKDKIRLSVRDEKIWDKNFKLRLTSIDSKRSLDLNLKFKARLLDNNVCPPEETNYVFDAEPNTGVVPPDLGGILAGGLDPIVGSAYAGPTLAGPSGTGVSSPTPGGTTSGGTSGGGGGGTGGSSFGSGMGGGGGGMFGGGGGY